MKTHEFKINDVVSLSLDLPTKGLSKGAVGTIVENWTAELYEVEFCDSLGHSIAMVALTASQMHPHSRGSRHSGIVAFSAEYPTELAAALSRSIYGSLRRKATGLQVSEKEIKKVKKFLKT